MKAIIHERYGDPAKVLRLGDVDEPMVKDDAVLVRVRAASVNAGDWRAIRASPFLIRLDGGLRRPKSRLIGVDAAGVVEDVGRDATDLKVGDQVYGMRNGAFAELVAGKSFVPMPRNLTFEQAAAVPAAGCTALQAVRDRGRVQAGQRVLINGAGGGVGSFAVQIARAMGAEVTGATRTANLEMVRSIGADHVIDYSRQEFGAAGDRYDVIIDCGGKPSIGAFRRALAPAGHLVLVAAGKGRFGVLGRMVGAQVRRRLLKQRVTFFIAGGPFNENLLALKELIEAGEVAPVIDRTYPLEDAAQAIRYVETERSRGKVVIRVTD